MDEIVWKPTNEYVENANITRFMKKHSIKNYDDLIKKSTDDIEWFWDAVMRDLNIEWFHPYEKVLDNLKKLPELEGKGTIDKKLSLISELLTSASGIEAKYIIRTLLGDLRVGTGEGTLRDSIRDACFEKSEDKEKTKTITETIQDAYDKATDWKLVFEQACKGLKELESTELTPGKPVKVMLFPKEDGFEDGFKRVGKPALIDYKYDGFRMMINKANNEIKVFTRRLDDVSRQFPEVTEYVKKYVRGDSFILDSEAVGFDPKTKKYRPFQEISQRIKRKYDIDKVARELPVEINVFDIIYYNNKSLIKTPFKERRKIIEKIVKKHPYKIRPSEAVITGDVEKAAAFYEKAVEAHDKAIALDPKNPSFFHKINRVLPGLLA